jgi:hypothetical protein
MVEVCIGLGGCKRVQSDRDQHNEALQASILTCHLKSSPPQQHQYVPFCGKQEQHGHQLLGGKSRHSAFRSAAPSATTLTNILGRPATQHRGK